MNACEILMLQIFTNGIANLANAFDHLMKEMNTQRVLANVFSLSLIWQHPLSELLVSKCQVVILHHTQGRRNGGGGEARESFTIPLLNTKTLLLMAQHPVMTKSRWLRP